MPIVNIEGLGQMQFPDDMSQEQIANAIETDVMPRVRREKLVQSNPEEYDPNSDEFRKKYGASAGSSFGQNLIEGIGRGYVNVVRNVGNLTGLYSDEKMRDAQQMDADLLATGGGKIGSAIGETAILAVPGAGASGLLAKGALGARAAAVASNPIGRGALEGAYQGFVTAGPDNRVQGAALGGAFGAALPAGYKGYKLARDGMKVSPAARQLLDAGVDLTPGQANPTGAFAQLEEVGQKVTGLGQVISGARENAESQFRQLVAREAMPPGMKLQSAATDASELLMQVKQSYNAAYEVGSGFPVSAKIVRTGSDIPLRDVFEKIAAKPRPGLTSKMRGNELKVLQENLDEAIRASVKSKQGLFSDDLFKLRSFIREQQRSFNQPGAQDSAYRSLYKEADDAITKALDSQLPKDVSAAVKAIDSKYAKFKILEDAVERGSTRPGDKFSAYQLAQSVKKNTPKPVHAIGGGATRDLADAGLEAFSPRQVPTGAMMGALGTGTAALYATGGWPAVLAGAGAMAGGIGTRTGRRILLGRTAAQNALRGTENKLLSKTPELVRKPINALGRYGAVAESNRRANK